MAAEAESTLVIDQTTVISLLSVLVLLITTYTVSVALLPKTTSARLRVMFIWHLFDSLIHFLYEGSFLYNCFFTYASGKSLNNFLSQPLRTYGSFYGTSPTAKLWQEYAKADRRWGESDEVVISLELLTVLLAGPIAVWVCYLIVKQDSRMWFWATMLATGELYGGFMTFAPEWLTGSRNLDTSNFMYLWVYLFFFNMLWVVFPFWVLFEANHKFQAAFAGATPLPSKKKV